MMFNMSVSNATTLSADASTGRRYAGESPDQRAQRRRQQLLDAGLELFGTIGFQATTVRTLAKQAGVTDRYFYESFANMEELLIAVYRMCLDRVQVAVAGVLESPVPTDPDQLAQEIRAAIEAFLVEFEDRRVARVLWGEILGVGPALDAVYSAGIRTFTELVAAGLRATYPPIDRRHRLADQLAIALVGAISQTALHWLIEDYRTPRKTLVDAIEVLFLGLTAFELTTQLSVS